MVHKHCLFRRKSPRAKKTKKCFNLILYAMVSDAFAHCRSMLGNCTTRILMT